MKKHVLIVDDETTLTRLMQMNLEDTGDFEVRVINDPDKAVEAARHFHPDVIILDIVMPGMSGMELAGHLRAVSKLADVPILFLSAAISREDPVIHEEAIKDCPVLVKPVSLDDLIKAINDAHAARA